MRRIVCAPGYAARQPWFSPPNSADSIGKPFSSDVTSTKAILSTSSQEILLLALFLLPSDLNNGLNYNEQRSGKGDVMAEEIRRVDHYSVSIPNKVGEGARVLGALRDDTINDGQVAVAQ